ncbi:MAG: sigma-54 dependent transcriptional regulator [Thermodesulfobacteriota bacterium]
MMKKPTILVVDDEFGVLQSFKMVLKDRFEVLLSETGVGALKLFNKNHVDLILLDILLQDGNGLDLLQKFKELEPAVEIIMITAVKDIQTAVKAIRLGAYDYILKPFDVEDVLKIIQRALEKKDLLRKVVYLKNELGRFSAFEEMVGKDDTMMGIFDLISMISASDGTVLIQGESGTGKELVARAIHNRSSRKDQPFVVINCAAIPPTLMESEIFGYQKGAFTGAVTTVSGKLELADGGTVFLDDIDSLEINMQAKLLRVIQEKEFEKVGSHKLITLEVRFIASSNKNLLHLIGQGKFREDLYYRLNVLPIELPPLRTRTKDILLLINYFLDYFSRKTGKPLKTVSAEAVRILTSYDWPGNVRELKNLMERLTTIVRGPEITLSDVSMLTITESPFQPLPLKEAVGVFEKGHIQQVMERVKFDKNKAARILNIHRNTLVNKLNEYDLNY